MENKVICSKPFTEIYNMPGRNYAPCCWAKNVSKSNPYNALPLDHFDGEEFRQIRKEMLLGERTDFLKSVCHNCYMLEDESKSSPRIENPLDDSILQNFNSDGSLISNNSRFITVAINIYGNYCNLECYGCKPQNSTARNSAMKKLDLKWNKIPEMEIRRYSLEEPNEYLITLNDDVKKIDRNQFDKIIDQLIENSHRISSIEIVGGEAALMKSHFDLLDKLISCGQSKNITLSYVTNMTILNLKTILKYIDCFKYTFIQWSIDALEDKNYWLRYPTDWESTVHNVLEVQKYFKFTQSGSIKSTITPSLLSIPYLKETYQWLYDRKLISPEDYIFNTVKNPKMLRTRNLPNELKDQIAQSVKSISEFHYSDMMQERNENEFRLAIEYFDALDKSRGTDWRSTFPEISKYA